MTKITGNLSAAYDGLSGTDKEALRLSGRIIGQSILFSILKVTVVYAYGRKLAPNVFKSWGRTFAVVSLIEAATNRYSIPEADKKAIADIRIRQTVESLAKTGERTDYDES